MTNEEKQAIVNEVLAALHTHGKTIGQLTPVTSPSDSDTFELSGGRNLSYGKLKELITAIFTAALTGYVPADSLWDYIQQYIAKLGTNGALDWQESPIVMLATMGTSFDNVDGELPAYTLQEGDMYYQYGVNYQIFRKLAQGSEGMPAKADVVYFNMRTWRTYKWTGSTMVEIAKPKSRVVLADLHTQNYNSMATGTIAYNPIAKKIVEKVTSTSWSVSDPDPDYIYCDAQTNTSLRWDATNSAWVQIGGGSGGSVLKDVTFEDGNLIFTFETEQGEQVITVPIEFDASNYVPITRTVNGKALSQDITIGQSDISGLTAALAALVPQTRTINGKALSSNVNIGMSDIQGLVDAINNAGSGAVSVTTNQDGTFVIHVGETDYTINLNHTHENMAKLIVCEESDLPSTLEMDTIYAQVDNATDPTEIQSLWIAGLEFVGGGGDPEPRLRFPTNGSQINVDDLTSGGLLIRGYNLSQPLLVTVTGDFTINGGSSATVQATDANAGTTLTLACTSQSYNATGSLVITSSEGINTSCSLIANVPNYESITAAVFSGTQWVNMGFSVGPNTSFEWDVQFEKEDSQIAGANATFFSCNSYKPSLFQANFSSGSFDSMYFWVGESNVYKSGFSLGRGVFRYANQDCSYRGVILSPPEVTFTASDFSLGVNRGSDKIFNHTRMIVFGLKVYENNVLTHDFVPKKFDSFVGFYDNLTGAFVSSQTSTELEEYNS